jgi:uncharacterized protein (DUF58 family)
MIGRRLTYVALLLGTAVLHFAYGQYETYFVLLFMLLLPVFSLLLSLPAILTTRAELSVCGDVRRGREGSVTLHVSTRFFLPPEVVKITIEHKNLFLDARAAREKVRIFGARDGERTFAADTDRLGMITYRMRRARCCDYLGLFAIPIRKSGPVAFSVLPNAEPPVPVPELVEPSPRIMKPKPLGFSEEHELRPYREGDSINLIHWKLSEKYDETIVREPQELIRKNVVLSLDRYGDYGAQQSVLEQLRFLSDLLLENDITYLLHFGLRCTCIRSDGEFGRFLRSALSEPIRDEKAAHVAPGSDTLVYRILPKKEARV